MKWVTSMNEKSLRLKNRCYPACSLLAFVYYLRLRVSFVLLDPSWRKQESGWYLWCMNMRLILLIFVTLP